MAIQKADPNALLRCDLNDIKTEIGQIRDRIIILSQRLKDKAELVGVVEERDSGKAGSGALWLDCVIDDLSWAESQVGYVIKQAQT